MKLFSNILIFAICLQLNSCEPSTENSNISKNKLNSENAKEKNMAFYNGIVTSKLKESKQFYTKNLGFSVKFENEWFILLENDGRELAFMQPNLEFQNQIFQGEYGGKGLWLTVEVDNVEVEYKRIKSLGIPIVVELKQEERGETHFSIADPNGIGLDFVKYKAPENDE